jgi:hypothetical protein
MNVNKENTKGRRLKEGSSKKKKKCIQDSKTDAVEENRRALSEFRKRRPDFQAEQHKENNVCGLQRALFESVHTLSFW